mgnify:CR=1 FL=1|jgi:hypothetical protein
MEWVFAIVAFFIGAILSFVGTANLVKHIATDDAYRLDNLSLFGWTTACTSGRWAVLKQVNGEMKVIGTTYATLREAIDTAIEIESKV